jgi:hypothetical protein
MLMDNDHTFSRTTRPDASPMSRGEVWETSKALALEATRMYANMFATSGVYMIGHNICLANCAITLSNCVFTFDRRLRRRNTPFALIQLQ